MWDSGEATAIPDNGPVRNRTQEVSGSIPLCSTNVVTITTFSLEMDNFRCPVAYPIAQPRIGDVSGKASKPPPSPLWSAETPSTATQSAAALPNAEGRTIADVPSGGHGTGRSHQAGRAL